MALKTVLCPVAFTETNVYKSLTVVHGIPRLLCWKKQRDKI